MYPIYVDGCGEMKMRLLKISNIFWGGGEQASVLPSLKRFFLQVVYYVEN